MSKPPTRGTYTLQDWLAQPEDARVELIDGELIPKAAPRIHHSVAQFKLCGALGRAYGKRGQGPDGPGGWVFGSEADILLDGNVFRPDVSGWRRERLPKLPDEFPLSVRPDWICEVISDSNRKHDTVLKVRRYHAAGIPHYWLLDEPRRELSVYRHMPEGYLVALIADASECVRAEPFDAIELHVAALFGDDPEDPPAAL